MNIQNNGINAYKVGFSGHKKVTDNSGYEIHRFYYLYDKNKYECTLEVYNIRKDDKGNYSIGEKADIGFDSMDNGPLDKDISDYVNSEEGFAYRFKLRNKKTNQISYAFDNGSVIGIFDKENEDSNKYNLVLNNRAIINKNGPMQLIMPDGYNPGVRRKDGTDINTAMRARALTQTDTEE